MFFYKKSNKRNDNARKFKNLVGTANQLPKEALADFIKAILLPMQTDLLLAVAEDGDDARQAVTASTVFFDGIDRYLASADMSQVKRRSKDYPLSLVKDIVLPCPWKTSRFIESMSFIGEAKNNPWKQDDGNHFVDLWLPWKIGFVYGGNHSIACGILASEGILFPKSVYDMSYLFEIIRTDGYYWYENNIKKNPVHSYRGAAVFEIGRMMR